MRILLLTDSLGCPRTETDVGDTWTERIMKKWNQDNIVFYTYCMHGLFIKSINMTYIHEIRPDIIICQVGIVDACRRVMTKTELAIISRIPLLSKAVNRICKKYHYFFTRIRNIHYTQNKDFVRFFEDVSKASTQKAVIIEVAQPGEFLLKNTYHIKQDVAEYNNLIRECANEKTIIINPYAGREASEYLLEDGHHLNSLGLELVYSKVDEALNEIIQ